MVLDGPTLAVVFAIFVQSVVFAGWLGALSNRVRTLEEKVEPIAGLGLQVARLAAILDTLDTVSVVPKRRSSPRRKPAHAPFDIDPD